MKSIDLSFVIPLKNEDATLRPLLEGIVEAVASVKRSFEVIFVDDGSDDESWATVRALVEKGNGRVSGIRFRRNLGKAAALQAGFRAARGSVIFTLDADLQDDPREIPRFLEKLEEGYDIVCGWKKVRHDPWHKVLPSRVFNAMLSRMTRTPLHDHNCGFKCYRRPVVKELVVYGEMHRMIPALGSMRGFRATEIAINHLPRRFGTSKYGFSRFLRGFLDMFTVSFLQTYRERPLHAMGGAALMLALVGTGLLVLGCAPVSGVAGHTLQLLGGCLVASVAPLLGVGFLSELVVGMLPARASLPIAEEISSVEVTAGTELTVVGQIGKPRDDERLSGSMTERVA
jgi:dolichol-phosphate mannosyltransferase